MPFAHSKNKDGLRHDLVAHLRGVADRTEAFAARLGAAEVGRYLGLWHDLGKCDPGFQDYLLRMETGTSVSGERPDHKGVGAVIAAQHFGLLGLVVAGHHGGLVSPAHFRSWLGELRRRGDLEQAVAGTRTLVPDLAPVRPVALPQHVVDDPSAAEFFLRLLFSALVDADYLDTEEHFEATPSDLRRRSGRVGELWRRLDEAQQRLSGKKGDPVNVLRHEVYQACLRAAEEPPGLYRLTVPTGGGKTRSGLAFALRHALIHGQERVLFVLPFITVTEQTADVLRQIFETEVGEAVVLEHHSGALTDIESNGDDDRSIWRHLAAENWDAPVIVTTTVQLFESLFAARPARCRKLHRLARSVIVLDEAQALPPPSAHSLS